MMDREKLQDAVNSKLEPVFMKSKGEIWEYLLDKHKGDRKAAASEGARLLSGESSGKAYKNARRNFEERKGRLIGEAKQGETSKWRAFGKQLPPVGMKLPGNQITITVKGTQYEKGKERTREWSVTFTGADAYGFANNPSYRDFFRWLGYPVHVIDSFDGDDSSGVEVTSVV